MPKPKTAYVCNQCGAEYNKWQGQCEACGAWNTLSEFVVEPAKSAGAVKRTGYAGAAPARIVPLTQVAAEAELRERIGIGELDRVLGGGLVQGSVVLVGGDPGIGKSTLLLQVLGALGATAEHAVRVGRGVDGADRGARAASWCAAGQPALSCRNLRRAHRRKCAERQSARVRDH
jgi:predicted ATP-dependent serine protease